MGLSVCKYMNLTLDKLSCVLSLKNVLEQSKILKECSKDYCQVYYTGVTYLMLTNRGNATT